MRIAVLSDAHDNIWNMEKLLPGLKQAETLIFCGDFCAPFSLQMLAAGFAGPIHAVLGNNDGDPLLLSQVAARAGNVTLHIGVGHIEAGGARIAFAHYPQIGEALARSGLYQAVFSGHTHQRKLERFGDSLWVNPGEVMGRFGQPSYGLYNTASGEFQFIEI
jgi:hypothetical protein